MNRYFQPWTDRSATTECALALLMMIDDEEITGAPIIAELASQLRRQLARGDVGDKCERALIEAAIRRANVGLALH